MKEEVIICAALQNFVGQKALSTLMSASKEVKKAAVMAAGSALSTGGVYYFLEMCM